VEGIGVEKEKKEKNSEKQVEVALRIERGVLLRNFSPSQTVGIRSLAQFGTHTKEGEDQK
jgi:hypothetical protein